jgi:hypothetical protein
MALNDVRYISAGLQRSELEDVLIGLAKAANPYASTRVPERASINDFFEAFPEGHRELVPAYFYVQKRLSPKGRMGISYRFPVHSDVGRIRISVMDNGENVPESFLDEVCSAVRDCVANKGLKIVDEGNAKEY